jgi:hypothetical protein
MKVSVENGKYTVIVEPNGSMRALRYGEEWQDLTGQKLIYALTAEIDNLRKLQTTQLDTYNKLLNLNDKLSTENLVLKVENDRLKMQVECCERCGNEVGYCNCFVYDSI